MIDKFYEVRNVDECYRKLKLLLKEYECRIVIDEDIGIILLDKDSLDFVDLKSVS